ncbi:MAG: hypothetical protein AB1894_16145 [Chloroflexota bacterium]
MSHQRRLRFLLISRNSQPQPRSSAHSPTRCNSSAVSSSAAGRCLVFHNERPAELPLPAWIDPAWHNCLVGCMQRQNICPLNRELWDWIEDDIQFSQEETGLLLQGIPLDQLPAAMLEKLEQFELIEYFEILPRNLAVFFGQPEIQAVGDK